MDDNGGWVIWILAGVVGLLTVALCVGGGIAFYHVANEERPVAIPASGPKPGPYPAPGLGPPPGSGSLPSTGSSGVDLGERAVVAIISSGSGAMPVSVGTECRFTVRGEPQGTAYWCNAQIVCAGRLLYGGPRAGYFPCTLDGPPARHIAGGDAQTTADDTDASMSIDTRAGSLRIRDDASGTYGAYVVEARVTSVR